MLGQREPEIYGTQTLKDLENELKTAYKQISFEWFQSNHEGTLIDRIQTTIHESWNGLIINPGALTHYSISLHDALKLLSIPIIEVHLSNIYSRESFRHHSVISPLTKGVICGFGFKSYHLAIQALIS